MERGNLERYLERGNSFGFVKETDSDAYMGWVSLEKDKTIPRFFEILDESEDPYEYKRQIEIQQKPYRIRVCELKRSVWESENYPSNEDYNMNLNYRFSSLQDVADFLLALKLDLKEIKWMVDIPSD